MEIKKPPLCRSKNLDWGLIFFVDPLGILVVFIFVVLHFLFCTLFIFLRDSPATLCVFKNAKTTMKELSKNYVV